MFWVKTNFISEEEINTIISDGVTLCVSQSSHPQLSKRFKVISML